MQVLAEPKARNEKMRDELSELEMQMVEVMDDLNQEFERSFQDLVDGTKQAVSTYFSTIRDLEIVYFEAVTANVSIVPAVALLLCTPRGVARRPRPYPALDERRLCAAASFQV